MFWGSVQISPQYLAKEATFESCYYRGGGPIKTCMFSNCQRAILESHEVTSG